MLSPLSIVVVDDDPLPLADLCETLEERGYRVAFASSDGQRLIEMCQAVKPSLLIVDDGDDDLDLVVVSDFAGVDVYANDGWPCDEKMLDQRHLFGGPAHDKPRQKVRRLRHGREFDSCSAFLDRTLRIRG